MKKQARRSGPNPLTYSLTDEGVEFRNKWRGLIGMAIWLVLSSLSMVIMLLGSGADGWKNVLVIVGMSFVKYVPLMVVVYNLARTMAARYLDDVYELNDEDLASRFLEQVTFGYGHDQITINEGRISEEDEKSPVILIGGPGLIQVNLDSIALLETVTGEPEVIYPRKDPWKLGRFERIREIGKFDEVGKREYAIINLRDQFVSGLSVKSRTKDGIPLEAHDIKVIFSILRSQQKESDKVQGDAYLFDEKAVQALVYNQTIITPEPSTPSGITFPWDTTVIPLVVSELEDLIKSHNLNEILASISQKEMDNATDNDQTIMQKRLEMTGQQMTADMLTKSRAPNFEPRSEITRRFLEAEFKEKAAKVGVSIQWIDIGNWQLPSTLILDKHKEAWNLSRQNANKRKEVETFRKKREAEEILKLVERVIIRNYYMRKSEFRKLSNEEMAKLSDLALREYRYELQQQQQGVQQKNDASMAKGMLEAFHRELLSAKQWINKENASSENTNDLNNIERALVNIEHLISPYK